MFEHFMAFNQILVTGPQRSGTRACAKMIADDTGYRFVDEREFGTGDEQRLRALLEAETDIVVQCPALCDRVHELAKPFALVIFMHRDLAEILASEERINWNAKVQLQRYDALWERMPIAQRKEVYWHGYQADAIEENDGYAIELDYTELTSHPLWVPPEERNGWRWDQTERDEGEQDNH